MYKRQEYISEDSVVELLDMRTYSANLAYQHSLSLLYLKAVMDVLGDVDVEIENSLNKGLYTEIKTPKPLTQEQVDDIQEFMRQLVTEDRPIIKEFFSKEEAIDIWKKYCLLYTSCRRMSAGR